MIIYASKYVPAHRGTLTPIRYANFFHSGRHIFDADFLGTQNIMGTLVEPDMFALNIEVSEGELDKEITLNIRRRGGSIEVVMRGFGGIDSAACVRRAQGGIWDTLRPPGGCVIALSIMAP
ncbi:hypothetical protein FRC12_024902 [Ceratobasidium sp. 428]|nr:hypothetical protein FRC12_024902 [Ceratobasidium sp. 428]